MLSNPTELAKRDWLRGTLTDEAVVKRVLAGESELFELLMRRHNRRLFRIVRAMLRDDVEAEDALQEAYVTAFQKLATFEGRAAYLTWQTRIAMNEANARLRRLERASEALEKYGAKSSQSVETDGGPEAQMAGDELRALIERCVDALPHSNRVVFMMRRIEGMSITDTACALETTEEAVKSRLHRANEELRRLIERRVDVSIELSEAFAFDGERCDRIVARVLGRVATT